MTVQQIPDPNTLTARALADIVQEVGVTNAADPQRLRGMMNDLLGVESRRLRAEIDALVLAANESIPEQLWAGTHHRDETLRRLQHRGLSAPIAEFAIEAWRYALGLPPALTERPSLPPPSIPPPTVPPPSIPPVRRRTKLTHILAVVVSVFILLAAIRAGVAEVLRPQGDSRPETTTETSSVTTPGTTPGTSPAATEEPGNAVPATEFAGQAFVMDRYRLTLPPRFLILEPDTPVEDLAAALGDRDLAEVVATWDHTGDDLVAYDQALGGNMRITTVEGMGHSPDLIETVTLALLESEGVDPTTMTMERVMIDGTESLRLLYPDTAFGAHQTQYIIPHDGADIIVTFTWAIGAEHATADAVMETFVLH